MGTGLPSEVIEGALRIGIGKFTTDEEIDQAAEILSTTISQTRKAIESTTIGFFC